MPADKVGMGGLRLPALTACFVLAVLGLASSAAAGDDPYAALLAPTGTCAAAADQLDLDAATAQLAMQCLTNYARGQQSLPPLQLSSTLNAAGQAKLTTDLSCGEFSHTPCGQPFDAVFAAYVQGATSYQIGENIAWGTGSFGTPRQTMNGWLHSTGHRENILTAAYAELGVGYLPGQTFQGWSGATLWSQEFGLRSPAAPPTTTTVASKPVAKPKPKRKPHKRRQRNE
jgi:uncharacterized protein YkwD